MEIIHKALHNEMLASKNLRMAVYIRGRKNAMNYISAYEISVRWYLDWISEKPNWNIVAFYEDMGVPYNVDYIQCKGICRLLEDASANKMDVVITKDERKFGRNLQQSFSVVRELNKRGIGVFFVNLDIYISEYNGEIFTPG